MHNKYIHVNIPDGKPFHIYVYTVYISGKLPYT